MNIENKNKSNTPLKYTKIGSEIPSDYHVFNGFKGNTFILREFEVC